MVRRLEVLPTLFGPNPRSCRVLHEQFRLRLVTHCQLLTKNTGRVRENEGCFIILRYVVSRAVYFPLFFRVSMHARRSLTGVSLNNVRVYVGLRAR